MEYQIPGLACQRESHRCYCWPEGTGAARLALLRNFAETTGSAMDQAAPSSWVSSGQRRNGNYAQSFSVLHS